MSVFDPAVFDPAVFDTGAAIAAGHGGRFAGLSRRMRMAVPAPPEPEDDVPTITALLL